MSVGRLLFRSLLFHWRSNLGVALGIAVATAVLSGALLIGDSLRGSLRDLAEDRLGAIDLAVVGEQFFPADLADRWHQQAPMLTRVNAVVMLRGAVLRRDAQDRVSSRIGQVHVVGVDEDFWGFFGQSGPELGLGYAINSALADDLGAGVGTIVEVRIEKPQAVPTDSILADRHEPEGIYLEPNPVTAILPNEGPGRFSLAMQQANPRILYVPLRRLQQRLERDANQLPGGANVLLAESRDRRAPKRTEAAQAALNSAIRLEDAGLRLRTDSFHSASLVLETRRMILEPAVVDAALAATRTAGWKAEPVMSYLANVIYRHPGAMRDLAATIGTTLGQPSHLSLLFLAAAGSAYSPYSAVAGLDLAQLPVDATVRPHPALRDDEVLLSEVVARDLWPFGGWQREQGQPVVAMQYFVEADGYLLKVESTTLKLAGVYPARGAMVDRTLTPEFPGLRTRIQDWKPPFPREQWHPQWIRDVDERYYREHRVSPKALVSPMRAKHLWASRFGSATSIRMSAPGKTSSQLEAACREHLHGVALASARGMTVLNIRDLGVAASESGTANMFGGLFVGFSWFLIVAAVMLVGLLFRLGIERRGGELGLYHALGLPHRLIARLFQLEGAVISVVGCVLGTVVGIGYAWLLIQGLRWGWRGGLDGSVLRLHVAASDPMLPGVPYPSLFVGFVSGFVIALATIAWSLRGIAGLAPAALLARRGWSLDSGNVRSAGWFRIILAISALAAVVALAAGAATPPAQAGGWFFASGLALLVCGLSLLGIAFHRPWSFIPLHGRGSWLPLARLGASNATRNPGRNLLTSGLLACALFLIIAVDSFRKSSMTETDRGSGTGGFALVAEADIPLPSVPRDEKALKELLSALPALADKAYPTMPADLRVYGCRLRPGDDASCMNLYQPRRPRILGVTAELMSRGGFSFHLPSDATDAERANPWQLLSRHVDGEIPILADDHTAQWVLQKGIGDTVLIPDDHGREITLRIVGMFRGSLFQSELVMSETNFKSAFPHRGGYSLFLVDVAPTSVLGARHALNDVFGEAFGFDAKDARDRLALFQSVENTYLSTFQALGGLGLLLGTIGLGVVLMRNLNDRRSELALLRAVGFSEPALRWLILTENGVLMAASLVIGGVAATLAVMPALVSGQGQFPIYALAWLTVLVPAVGMAASAVAIRISLFDDLIPTLRRE